MPRRLLLPLTLLALLAAAPIAEAKPGPKLTVMTRNIYLGGNIALPIGATSREDFEAKTTQLWQQVQATDFPARAKLLAREVRKTKPDVIGLQEVALWRRGPDGVKDGVGDAVHHHGLRLPGHAARRARLALPPRQRADRGRHRGADQPRLRRAGDDARRRARAQAQGPAHPPQAGRQLRGHVRGPDPDRHAQLAARLDGDRRRAARQALPLRRHAPGGVRRRDAAGPGARARGRAAAQGRHGDPRRRHQLRPDRRHGREARRPTTSSRAPACATPGCCATRRAPATTAASSRRRSPTRRPGRSTTASTTSSPRGASRSCARGSSAPTRPTGPRAACGPPTTAAGRRPCGCARS